MTIEQRCSRCLMPNTYPGISFDANGVCNQCNEFQKKEPLGEKALRDILNSGRGGRYDCIVGISGGKDSCYVTYLAKRHFNLRTLAVCYDFPFLCALARDNIRNVCRALDVDLVVIKSKNNLERELMRNHLMSLSPTGTSWGQCIFCHYGIEAILFNVAKEKGVPFILGGITNYELWNPGSRTKFAVQRLKRLSIFQILRFVYYQSRAYLRLVDQRRQFSVSSANIFDVYRRAKMPDNGPITLNMFDYIKWDQNLIERTLMKETGWVKPSKSVSWRYDCVLEPFLDYTYKKEFGISTVGIYLSQLIRDGGISREEASQILMESEQDDLLHQKLETVFEDLRIPRHVRNKFFSVS